MEQWKIPEFLQNKLKEQYGRELAEKIFDGYERERPVTLRVNTLKVDTASVKESLQREKIGYHEVLWSENALVIENVRESELKKLELYESGKIYLQSLSSMLPPLILEPKAGESILDMAAAPGGKTTQIAAISGNMASITACEKNRVRAQRLQYNIEKQGASRVCVMETDARKLDDFFSFDKVLLDAPCTGSGTLDMRRDGRGKLNEELIRRSSKVQGELLAKALKLLKPGHEMVYSTCSVLKEENEQVIGQALKKNKAEVVPIERGNFAGVPLLPVALEGTLCVCPNGWYEGFFVAKIRKGG